MKRSFQLALWTLLYLCSLQAAEAPKLIVFISIDQMRADHLQRFGKEYSSGFRLLLAEGVWYRNAELGYANTSTAPGHATMSTGVFPWKSGIIANSYPDRIANRRVYSVEDSTVSPIEGAGGKRSPRNLLASTFGDWLKSASQPSKVISVSYKDRAAILMGGHKADAAFWYDRSSGHLMTSTYYTGSMPGWAHAFNEGNWIEKNVPESWTKLKPESVYDNYGPDALEGEALWDGKTTFPHDFTKDKKAGQVFDTPYGNSMLLDFALSAIDGEKLGQRGVTDLLCVSLSTTDAIGSAFGPNSHEMVDNQIRLDLALGAFLDDIVARFGKQHVLVVVAGDHGAMQLPEYLTTVEKTFARRFDNRKEVQARLRQLDSLVRIELNASSTLVRDGFVNYPLLKEAGVDPKTIERRVRDVLRTVDGVEDVYFATELLDPKTPQRPYLDAYRHSLMKDRSPDFVIRDCEFCLVTEAKTGTSHGSPYSYDVRVPIIFWGAGFAARRIDRPVHTVDIAPSLSKILKIQTPPGLDGVVLKELKTK